MELPIGIATSLSSTVVDDLLRRIATGQGLLFLGSGYSRNATNVHDEKLPTAEALAHELCKINKMPADDDLRYVAERLIEEGYAEAVVATLRGIFSVKHVESHHVEIAKANWRRTYTTNYDLVFEHASAKAGRAVETVSIDVPPAQAIQSGPICVHLNGSIQGLVPEALNISLKLSNSSYESPDSFVTSRWLYPFRQDLERSTAIVFVGYSLYDIEIKKILFENPEFKEKVFFITAPDLSEKEKFTLGRYGVVIPIGAEGFSAILSKSLSTYVEESIPLYTTAIARYGFEPSTSEVRDADVERFLMHGDIHSGHIDQALIGTRGAPFLVPRLDVQQIIGFAESGKNVVVTSDFGNGKSVVARTILSSLAASGREVYELVDLDGDYLGDYEKITASLGRKYVVIDSYTRSAELVEHHTTFGKGNVTLILLARASDHERARRQLSAIDFDYVEANLDVISTEEAGKFVDIIDNVGMWGDEAALTREKKISRISHDGRGHISEILLTIFDAPQMKARIEKLLASVLANEARRDTLFSICILEFLSLNLSVSLISRAALNDEIYSAAFRNDEGLRGVYAFDGGRVSSKSSVFGLALIRNNFSPSYVVSQLLRIVESVNDDRGESREVRELFKSLLRFSTVERLLPERNKKDNLVKYYEQLKRSAPWLTGEPHFWVQYAMALLTFNEFDRAQGLLDQSYALAEKRVNYHTDNIDTQQARLFILRSLAAADGAQAARHFSEAHSLLSAVPNDVGKFRQLERYEDVYRQKFPSFSSKSKVEFEHACTAVRNSLAAAIGRNELPSSRGDFLARGVLASVERVLDEIKGARCKN